MYLDNWTVSHFDEYAEVGTAVSFIGDKPQIAIDHSTDGIARYNSGFEIAFSEDTNVDPRGFECVITNVATNAVVDSENYEVEAGANNTAQISWDYLEEGNYKLELADSVKGKISQKAFENPVYFTVTGPNYVRNDSTPLFVDDSKGWKWVNIVGKDANGDYKKDANGWSFTASATPNNNVINSVNGVTDPKDSENSCFRFGYMYSDTEFDNTFKTPVNSNEFTVEFRAYTNGATLTVGLLDDLFGKHAGSDYWLKTLYDGTAYKWLKKPDDAYTAYLTTNNATDSQETWLEYIKTTASRAIKAPIKKDTYAKRADIRITQAGDIMYNAKGNNVDGNFINDSGIDITTSEWHTYKLKYNLSDSTIELTVDNGTPTMLQMVSGKFGTSQYVDVKNPTEVLTSNYGAGLRLYLSDAKGENEYVLFDDLKVYTESEVKVCNISDVTAKYPVGEVALSDTIDNFVDGLKVTLKNAGDADKLEVKYALDSEADISYTKALSADGKTIDVTFSDDAIEPGKSVVVSYDGVPYKYFTKEAKTAILNLTETRLYEKIPARYKADGTTAISEEGWYPVIGNEIIGIAPENLKFVVKGLNTSASPSQYTVLNGQYKSDLTMSAIGMTTETINQIGVVDKEYTLPAFDTDSASMKVFMWKYPNLEPITDDTVITKVIAE